MRYFFRFDCFDIRQVGKVPDPVAEHLQAVMADIHRSDPEVSQGKGLSLFHQVDRHCRSPRIAVFICEDIVKALLQGGYHPFMGIDGDISLPEKKGPDIINASCMIGMFMGKKDGVEPAYIVAEHLLPEIGPAIDDDVMAVHLYHHGYPKAFVPGILTETYRMCAPDDGDSL